jgi:hypothetical protein
MDIRDTNRANQLPIEPQYTKGVNLIDVDTTLAEYIGKVIIPDVEENGNKIKVPLLYGNAERWTNARKEGYLRDQRGQIQIPLVMFKRNSIERDSSLQHFREQLTMPSYQKYTNRNRYEKFSLQTGAKPSYEIYNVRVPAYVTVTYEVMIWTSFTEHMNKIVEAFQYASDRYWGEKDGYKFRTRIDSFDNQQEVGQGSERIIRTSFTMVTNAYLLPETFNEKPITQKAFTPKKIVFGVEVDVDSQLFSNPLIYNDYAQVVDFIATNGSQLATLVDQFNIKLIGVKAPPIPTELIGVFDPNDRFKVYINGALQPASSYTFEYGPSTNELIFTFPNTLFGGAGLDENDEIAVTGKFEVL